MIVLFEREQLDLTPFSARTSFCAMGRSHPIKAANALLNGPQPYVASQSQDAVFIGSVCVLKPNMPKNGSRHRRVRLAAIGEHQHWLRPVLKPVKDAFLREHTMQKREISFAPLTAVGLACRDASDPPFKWDSDGAEQLGDHFLHRPVVEDAPV